jgi:hypothetical protein
MDKIIVEYQLKTEELRKELGDVKKQLSDTEKQVETSGSKMSNVFKNIGAAVLGAFAVREVVAFGREVEALARKAEGVEKAFKNIANAGTLEELRKATRGTVSDLQLMQNAVKANNFQIPLDQLGKLFAFANQRARETGESVDYLVDSIVLGIGRKSPLILDNLGISAIRLREEFKGLGVESAGVGDVAAAVGRIIDEEMGKAANSTTEAADAADRAAATYENLKVELGQKLTPVLTQMRIAMNNFLEDTIMALKSVREIKEEVLGEGLRRDAELTMVQFQQWQKSMADVGVSYGGTAGAVKRYIEVQKESLAALKEDIKTHGLTETRKKSRDSYYEGIKALEAYYKELTTVGTTIKETDDSTKKLTADMAIFKEVVEKIPSLIQPIVTQLDRLQAAAQDTDFSDFYGSLDEQQRFLDIQNELIFSGQQLNPNVIRLTSAYQSGLVTLEQYSDRLKQIKEDQDAARESAALSSEQSINDIFVLGNAIAGTFGAISFAYAQLGKENEKLLGFSKQAAFAEIILSQGVAIAKALQVASTSATNPLTFFTSLATILTAIFATIGQATSIASSAKIPKYATGVVDLKGAGTETSDSITARLSKGESVITAKGTRQDKGLFQAANKLRLEEYINKNYVLPVLLKKQQEDKAMFDDYRLYLALKDGQRQDRELNKAMIKAVTQRHNRYNNWN